VPNEISYLHYNLAEKPLRLREVVPYMPAELDELLDSMMEKERASRPQSMAEVEARLLSIAASEGWLRRPVPYGQRWGPTGRAAINEAETVPYPVFAKAKANGDAEAGEDGLGQEEPGARDAEEREGGEEKESTRPGHQPLGGGLQAEPTRPDDASGTLLSSDPGDSGSGPTSLPPDLTRVQAIAEAAEADDPIVAGSMYEVILACLDRFNGPGDEPAAGDDGPEPPADNSGEDAGGGQERTEDLSEEDAGGDREQSVPGA
jgi:hypothetical protein